jgi:type II secretory pathway component PulJ
MKTSNMNSKQTGATLMEVLVAMSISLVVTAAMIAMMANSLGSTARIIKMTKLTDDMRVALQLMSRDVRRSSYNANSMFCYANTDCASDGAITAAAEFNLPDLDSDSANGRAGNCFTFLTDRDHDGDSTEDDAGGFRHVTIGAVGVIEMWTGDAAPDCASAAGAAGWVQITNPENMDIFAFSVDDNLSYTQVIKDDGVNPTVSQRVRKVTMDMQGRLVMDNTITRQMEDVIAIRNDLLL